MQKTCQERTGHIKATATVTNYLLICNRKDKLVSLFHNG